MRDRKRGSQTEERGGLLTDQPARDELHAVVQELEGLQGRLLGLRNRLPTSPTEMSPQDDPDADPDVPVEIRRVIECVLQDSIRPAIRDLLGAAEYRPGEEAGEEL
jgi:hypothetical protein